MAQARQGGAAFAAQLDQYLHRWPAEAASLPAFRQLLADPGDPFVRESLQAHFTGSAWVVSMDEKRNLLTQHSKMERWLQPGAHADGDGDRARVALKEAEDIFDLDRHWIPERKGVPGHWHCDVRYVVWAGKDEQFVVSEESHDLAWREISQLVADSDESMSRMASKWLARR